MASISLVVASAYWPAAALWAQSSGDAMFLDGFEAETLRLTIEDAQIGEGDSGARSLIFPISFSRTVTSEVSFDFATMSGTASSDDFIPNSGSIELSQGQIEVEIAVEVSGDICVEDNEQFTVMLTNLQGDATLTRDRAIGTIETDDPLPQVTISGSSVIEGNNGNTVLQFSVELDKFSCTDVAVDFETRDDTAIGDDDYESRFGTLGIPAAVTALMIETQVIGDICVEPDETYQLVLSNPQGSIEIADSTADAIITNDDPLPILDIAPVAVNEGDSGTTPLTFDLTLDRVSCTDTVVAYNTQDLTAVAGSDYQPADTTTVIPAFQTDWEVIIDGFGDNDIEDNETFDLLLQNATPDVALGIASATGTLVNDDFFSGAGGPVLNDTGVTQP